MNPGLVGALIPVVAIVALAVLILRVARGPIGQALAHRLSGGTSDPSILAELAELRDEQASLRAELSEVHERLDFAERLLARPHVTEPEGHAGGFPA